MQRRKITLKPDAYLKTNFISDKEARLHHYALTKLWACHNKPLPQKKQIYAIDSNGIKRKIITRQEALALKLKRYFTGKACKHGHTSEYDMSCHCIMCKKEYFKEYSRKKDK